MTGDDSRREEMLSSLYEDSQQLSRSIQNADPETKEEVELQIKRIRARAYTANVFRKLKRDTDLDDMGERLAILEENELSGDDT